MNTMKNNKIKNTMNTYETFATTADVGIRITGNDAQRLLENAVKGLNLLYFGNDFKPPVSNRSINPTGTSTPKTEELTWEFTGDSMDNILVNLLSEMVFLLQTKEKITIGLDIKELTDTYINTGLLTIPRPSHLEAELEIKSVTYHNLEVKDIEGGKWAEIIFDI